MPRIGEYLVSDEVALLYELAEKFLEKMNELNGNLRDIICALEEKK